MLVTFVKDHVGKVNLLVKNFVIEIYERPQIPRTLLDIIFRK